LAQEALRTVWVSVARELEGARKLSNHALRSRGGAVGSSSSMDHGHEHLWEPHKFLAPLGEGQPPASREIACGYNRIVGIEEHPWGPDWNNPHPKRLQIST